MKRPVLTAAFASFGLRLQEMATAMSHDDIRTRLRAALSSAYEGTGNWCYIYAIFGDDQSGDVVYECGNDLMRAPYTCSPNGAAVDTTKAVEVVPVTTYELVTAGVLEAGRRNSSRDLKQLQAIHDSSVGLGAACSAKESRREGTLPKESAVTQSSAPGTLNLTESAATLEPIVLREARSDYEIKLIAPGKGSSAFYPAAVLERDGPKVFPAGTHVYLNHPTVNEETQRPEGDVANLAGVLTTTAVYNEAHAKGAGLYARMKVFADHATVVEEKAPHVGMSIRASGIAESGKNVDGLPILKELTYAASVDVVTKAGAGGMILTEAARRAADSTEEVSEMDAAELKKLQESIAAQAVQNAKLLERAIRGDAREEAVRILKGTTLIEAAKERVIESVLRETIPQTDGVLDVVKFTEAVNAAAKKEGAYVAGLLESGKVRGMGPAPVVAIDAKEAERQAADQKKLREAAVRNFTEMGMQKEAAEASADRLMGVA
jgi:hypothetical protein